jgi:hypothetical protein
LKHLVFIWYGLIGILCNVFAQNDTSVYVKQPTANHVLAAKLQPIKGEKQYITAEVIRLQGLTRLSDVLIWIDKAHYSTIDGERFYLNFNGTSTQQQQDFLLLVNGQKVELERWDAMAINSLGIPPSTIAYVEIINTPQIIDGQFAGKGAINIVTRNDFKGFTYTGYGSTGNKINDPGAAKYIQGYSSPNVDKVGYVYGHSLGYYGNKAHLAYSININQWYLPDETILNRFYKYSNKWVKNETITHRLEGAAQIGKLLIEGGGAMGEQKGYLYRNYLQNEIPANTDYLEGRLRLTQTLNNNQYVRLRMSANESSVINQNPLFPNYTYQTATLGGEYGRTVAIGKNKNLKQVSGYTLNCTSYNKGNTYQLQHKPYSSFSYNLSKKVSQQVDVALNIHNKAMSPSLVFKHHKTSSILNSASWVLSYHQNRISDQYNQLWNFYSTNQQLNPIAYPTKIYTSPTHLLAADYFFYISSSTSFKLTVNPGIKYHNNYHFISYNNQATFPLISDNTSAQTANFYTFTFGTNVHYDVFNNFWFDIDYYSANDKSSSTNLQHVLNNDSKRKLLVSLYLKLPGRIEIGTRTQAISKSSWLFYNDVGQLQNQTINGSFTTDLCFNKKLLGDVIQLNTSIKNIFNQKEQYHPLGSNFQLRFFLNIMVKLEDVLKYIPKK